MSGNGLNTHGNAGREGSLGNLGGVGGGIVTQQRRRLGHQHRLQLANLGVVAELAVGFGVGAYGALATLGVIDVLLRECVQCILVDGLQRFAWLVVRGQIAHLYAPFTS